MVEKVLSQYDLGHAAIVEPLGNAGGFSGSQLWKVKTVVGEFCLRRWPRPHPGPTELKMIHDVLQHVYVNGCHVVAVPLKSKDGQTLIRSADHAWEVSQWVSGAADFSTNPNDQRLTSAMHALAGFHVAAAQWRSTEFGSENLQTVIRNLNRVSEAVSAIAANNTQSTTAASELLELSQHLQRGGQQLAEVLLRQLKPFRSETKFQIQPVIRDIWHDHVFFSGDKVSGIVDFGAMSMDIVSFDLARLLGSLVGDDTDRLTTAIDAYAEIRPLSSAERELIPILDHCGVLIGSLNWFKWLAIENRTFESEPAVKKRIAMLTSRLTKILYE